MISGAMTSNAGAGRSDYQQNLESAPDSFMEEDDDSGDDVGKPINLGNSDSTGLNYDSDERNDEELAGGG